MGRMLWDKRTGRAMGGPSLAVGYSNCAVTLSRDCPQKNACSDSQEPEAWSPFQPAAGVVHLRGQARQDEDTGVIFLHASVFRATHVLFGVKDSTSHV